MVIETFRPKGEPSIDNARYKCVNVTRQSSMLVAGRTGGGFGG
jgi:hypothetical protein